MSRRYRRKWKISIEETVHPHLQHMRTQRYLKMQAVHLT